MKTLVWHVDDSWTTAFVRGAHRYLLPVLPECGRWGGGSAAWDRPESAVEVPVTALADTDVGTDALDTGPGVRPVVGNLPQPRMHAEMAWRRA
ncbi:hypothetical protein GCM10009609_21780 [Pseudonocardia aurantiaca]|uniref:Uncharacterized protein n=1 Tax=Pseudonocardia aurantiaca TaxID=75290 RepID=A0ABW4FER6_9PSEU